MVFLGIAWCCESNGFSGVQKIKFYNHPKKWIVIRPKKYSDAHAIADAMKRACDNDNLIFDVRRGREIIDNGIDALVKTYCDAPSLVRQCIIEGVGVDPGDFATASERWVLEDTGLFEPLFEYSSTIDTPLKVGDIVVTKVPGTTAIVVEQQNKNGIRLATKEEREAINEYINRCLDRRRNTRRSNDE